VDEGNPGGGAPCSTPGGVGACAAGTMTCVSASLTCVQNVQPSPEICDGVDNNCSGAADEGLVPTTSTCGLGACAATGQVTCQGGVPFDSCVAGTPGTEACDGADNDCNGVVDDVTGGCSLFVTLPLSGAVLDCTSPETSQPTITWNPAQYDKYKVYINTTSNFVATKGITSGDTLLKTTSWHVRKSAWVSLCKKATDGGPVYIRVQGVDANVAKSNPLRKYFSPVVTASAVK
jgi:hypothetical protein